MDKPSATEAEPILDPGRRILDPHHHLWPAGGGPAYLLDELRADTGDGHRIEATVFVECMTGYRTDGPEALRRAGESAFVARVARASRDGKGARIAGIVGSADFWPRMTSTACSTPTWSPAKACSGGSGTPPPGTPRTPSAPRITTRRPTSTSTRPSGGALQGWRPGA